MLEVIKHKPVEDGPLRVPASALASTRGSGASQRMLSVEGISTLAKFREMNINKLRHVAGLNGVRISLGKFDGCKPRKRTKAEILEDIKHKLVEDGPLLANPCQACAGRHRAHTCSKRRAPHAVEDAQGLANFVRDLDTHWGRPAYQTKVKEISVWPSVHFIKGGQRVDTLTALSTQDVQGCQAVTTTSSETTRW